MNPAVRATTRTGLRLIAALSASIAVAACASFAQTRVADGALTTPSGMTLYTFDRDVAASGKSACNGPCATLWPAYMASTASLSYGDYSVVTRDDGGKQWAFKGKPLYAYSKDSKAGDKTGDGFNNVWHIARP